MKDPSGTNPKLIEEISALKQRIKELEQSESARKRAEDALRESEKKYRLLIDTANESIIVVQDGLLKFVNLTTHGPMVGYSEQELSDRPFSEFIHPDDRSMVVENYRQRIANEGVQPRYPFRVVIRDGIVKWVEANAALIEWQDKPAILIFLTDITERKRAEEALQESEERYRRITEGLSDYLYTVRIRDGQVVETKHSQACAVVTGYTAREFAADPNLWIHMVVAEDRDLIIEHVQKILTGKDVNSFEHRIVRRDGQIRWVNVIPIRHLDSRGRLESYDGVIRDITERKRAEEEKRILEERLRHADKMEAIGTLAGGIAHDFNNLLMGIQGYASLTLRDLDPSHPHYERLLRIEEQVASGVDLTKQLLGFASGGRYEVKPADMNDILKKSSSMFGRTKKEITIHRKYGKDLGNVEVDRGQMEQVFMNLFVNAWQAMPGGGEIYLETEDVLLSDEQAVSYSVRPGKYVKISVTDTGTGMDGKTRERIFDPFFTTKGMGRGTGLGLATVYGIIKGHRGAINVYSEPGHGTTFNIYLPASEREVIGEKTETGTIAKGTETILLAEDEKMVLEVSREMLESLGYRVYAAGSSQEAIAVYMEKQKEIDLVILDMIMPGVSGGETFDRLREINSAVRVLLSSGYSIEGQAKTIMDRGCNGFLQKPFHLEKLSRMVREMID